MPVASGLPDTVAEIVAHSGTPIIEVKFNWEDAWEPHPEVEFVRATVASAGQDLSTLHVRRRYGRALAPHETGQSAPPASQPLPDRAPVDWLGWWVRVRLGHGLDYAIIWVGHFDDDPRDVFARMPKAGTDPADRDHLEAGLQELHGYGPLRILQRMQIHQSDWLVSVPDSESTDPEPDYEDVEKRLDWLPAMNGRDQHNMLVGNRTTERAEEGDDPPYLFGGEEVWTHYDFLEYIVKRHVQQYDTDWAPIGPVWTIGGSANLLKDLKTTVYFGDAPHAHEIINRLISPEYGVDWTIKPTDDGFEIHVYALLGESISFGGVTLPKNPAQVLEKVGADHTAVQVQFEKTQAHTFDKITVQGRRIICCCTLERYTDAELEADPQKSDSLEPLWTVELEAEYKAGSTDDNAQSPDEHDAARRAERFRPVYQMYRARAAWHHQKGKACATVNDERELAYPGEKQEGEEVPEGEIEANAWIDQAMYQNAVRATLSWTPLREGYRYYQTDEEISSEEDFEPVNLNPTDGHPDFLPPKAYLFDMEIEKYVLAEEAQVHVSNLREEIGLFLNASPNYLLAGGHWDDAEDGTVDPRFLMDGLVFTLAFETDRRLQLTWTATEPRNDGSHKIIEEDAELWYVAPETVVAVDEKGELKRVPEKGLLLRDDGPRMALKMAGAIARFSKPRYVVTVTRKGLVNKSDLVGRILMAVHEGGELTEVASPITAVIYEAQQNQVTTTIVAGFAS